jgi:hypothetical protein
MANHYGPGRGSWRSAKQDPVRRGGGRGFAASNRRQDGQGFWDTAQQQQESPFPAGRQQYPRIPRRNEFTSQQQADPNQTEEDADYSGHTEISERTKCFDKLLAIKSLTDRIIEFEKLPFEKRVTLVIPAGKNFAALPPQDVPPNWGELQEKAAVTTADWIKRYLFGPSGKHARDEEDSDSDFSSDGIYGRQNRKPELPKYLDFLDK